MDVCLGVYFLSFECRQSAFHETTMYYMPIRMLLEGDLHQCLGSDIFVQGRSYSDSSYVSCESIMTARVLS